MAKTCGYWECDTEIRDDHVVCREHYPDFKDGNLDKCPSCGRLKDAMYDRCLDCHRGSAKRTFRRSTAVRETPRRYETSGLGLQARRDSETDTFFVYICELDNPPDYYVGQTNDLKSRVREHRMGRTQTTNGRNPRLAWFTLLPTREAAEQREKELTLLKKENERAITRMVVEFQELTQLVDKT